MVCENFKLKRGSIFLIPLLHDGWGVGQILGKEKKCLNSIAVSLSSQFLQNKSDVIEPITKSNCTALFLTFPQNIENGKWKIVAHARVKTPILFYPYWKNLRFKNSVGASVKGENTIEEFLTAYHGQGDWDNLKKYLIK